MAKKNCLPIRVNKIGRWWWKETEIDILGLDTRNGKALALEVKWSNIDYREAQRLISELTTKTRQVKDANEITLGLMAKRIEEKEKIRREGFLALDLQDISEKFHTSKPAKNIM
jgi:AAA+ ATPase superfamily predicted ATPase